MRNIGNASFFKPPIFCHLISSASWANVCPGERERQLDALQVKELITFGCRTVTAQIQKGSLTTLLQLRSMMRNKACAKVRASYKVKAAASVSVSSCNRISRGLARVLRWSRKSVSATCLPTQHRFSSASMASFREVY